MKSIETGLAAAVSTADRSGSAGGWAPFQMLDGTDGTARLVFESISGRRHAARLDRWIAVIRLQRSAVRAARVVWLLDARTVRWSGGLPPRDLSRGATGLSAEETPILWFRAGDGDGADGPRVFTVSGVFGAAGVLDAARVRVAARRMRRQVRLRMAVDAQMWGCPLARRHTRAPGLARVPCSGSSRLAPRGRLNPRPSGHGCDASPRRRLTPPSSASQPRLATWRALEPAPMGRINYPPRRRQDRGRLRHRSGRHNAARSGRPGPPRADS